MKLTAFTTAFILSAGMAAAAPNCDAISGTWTGTMKGEKFNGPVSMTVNSRCKVQWTLPDGSPNTCDYYFKGKQLKYKCTRKSRGNVSASANRIVMQNVDTARQHGAYTATFRR